MKKSLLTAALVAFAMCANAQTVVFEDDFEWFAPWTALGNGEVEGEDPAGDAVGEDNESSKAPQMGMPKNDDGVTVRMQLHSKGYRFIIAHNESKKVRPADQQIYLQTNYLKFGLTGYQSGIAFPAVAEDLENVTVEFDWCPQRQGSKTDYKIDPVNLIVFAGTPVAEDENLNTTYKDDDEAVPVPTHGWENGHKLEWIHASVNLASVKAGQQIGITQLEMGEATANRWYLDNVKITAGGSQTAVDNIAVDAAAPAEYYNLQGVRIAEPENGMYIVRKGNRVSKVVK
ncbi:MAG: hypothetical protein J6J93_09220 [Muribaculaceae bacterium]|nr:hypothetical protein [Muribaculaceae bacterium]